jgi:5-methyltetrahydropteroyltriglutamate--homocysteine methyltransferase
LGAHVPAKGENCVQMMARPLLESKDELKMRIDQAAKYVPLEQLGISPQCGFASSHHGNPVTPDDQKKKLELVVDVAREVWGGV